MAENHGTAGLDMAGLSAIAEQLANGAALLDRAGSSAAHVPDTGVSTGLVGELLTTMSETLGDLVTAMDRTAISLRTGPQTSSAARQDSLGRLRVLDE